MIKPPLFMPPDTGLLSHVPHLQTLYDLIELTTINQRTFENYLQILSRFNDYLDTTATATCLPVKPSVIRGYLIHLMDKKHAVSTIKKALAAITWLHTINNFTDQKNPCRDSCLRNIGQTSKRIRAHLGLSNRPKQAKPITTANLQKIITKLPTGRTSERNKALLLLGFFAALRRSELASLHTNQITENPDGSLTILIPTSKTDQHANGQTVTIFPAKRKTLCPVRALEEHRTKNRITGYLFKGLTSQHQHIDPQTVNEIIQQCASNAGLSEHYTGHSLRRGMLVEAAKKGADINSLRVHARHATSTMTEHYIGQSALQTKNPTRLI